MYVLIATVAKMLVVWLLLCALWVGFLLEQENVQIVSLNSCVVIVMLVWFIVQCLVS
jgi:hypothetical protein